ncbi:MAG: glycosyltransferase family 2 protein [Flavobacteriales bacterium]
MKLSIVTVAYNAEATIAEAVQSVIRQQRNRYELEYIIVDGASTDGTLAAIEPYRSEITNVISEPDNGLYDAMNKGIDAATGDFIGILNADDAYADDGVLQSVAQALAESRADALYGDLDYVDGNNPRKVVRRWRSGKMNRRSFFRGWMPPHPTFFLSRKVYHQHGLYSEELRSAADYELMLRMLHKNQTTVTYLSKVLVKMKTGGMSNQSWGNRFRANREDRMAWHMNGLTPLPWTLILKPLRKLSQWF